MRKLKSSADVSHISNVYRDVNQLNVRLRGLALLRKVAFGSQSAPGTVGGGRGGRVRVGARGSVFTLNSP